MTPSARTPGARPLRAVVVASWFPAVDDTTKGRFVADQVAALRSTGAVEPVVVSFEPAQLSGGPIDRRRQAAAVRRISGTAVRTDPAVFAPSGWTGPVGIPVARLPVPSGGRGVGAPAHHAEDRRVALATIAGRLASPLRTIIHAHTGYPDGFAATALIDPLGAPLVITEHATFVGQQLGQPDQREAYLAGVRRAARLIAVSQALADELLASLPECGPKLVVIPNTVAMDEFRPGPLGDRRPDELLYVGYRTETKGIDLLLAAFARVRAERSGATLRLIGRSPNEEIESGWHRLAAELGVADAVTFDGPRLRPEIAAAMAEASILVHASRRETFGVAPVEALASGLPVVAADTAPLREILGADPGPMGALVPPGDAEALAAAILETLDRRASFDPVALRGAVEGRFGAAAVAQRIVGLYDDVLREGPDRRAVLPAAQPAALPVGGPSDRAGRRTLVVGFDTGRAALLLATLPAERRSEVALVCSAGSAVGDLPVDLAAISPVDLEGVPGASDLRLPAGPRGGLLTRIRRFAADPRGVLRRRRFRRQGDQLRRSAIARAIRALTTASEAGTDVDVVCLDGLDYLVAEPVLSSSRVRPAPGGLRWLADRPVHPTFVRPPAGRKASLGANARVGETAGHGA